MKRSAAQIAISFSAVFMLACCAQQNGFPTRDLYLSQKTPGDSPELFAPGIVSTHHHEHSSPAFSPDGSEVYWSVFVNFLGPQVILYSKEEDGRWAPPEVAPFSGQYSDGQPFLTRDGRKLFFESQRPINQDSEIAGDIDLWVVERTAEGWGEPKHLGFPINSDAWERGPTVSDHGNLYFSSMREGGFGQSDIYCSEWIDGAYSEPKNLGSNINTDDYETWPYIAPDERFIIFDSGPKGIVVSFLRKDGSWSEPIRTAERLQTKGSDDRFPMLSPDGRYFFFVSNRSIGNPYFEKPLNLGEIKEEAERPGNGFGDVYWLNAGFIEELKPEGLK